MNCEEALDLLLLCDSGEIDAEARRKVEEHLAACQSCREEAASLRRTLDAYRKAQPSLLPPASVRQSLAGRKAGQARHNPVISLLATAAAALLLASMAMLMQGNVPPANGQHNNIQAFFEISESNSALAGAESDLAAAENILASGFGCRQLHLFGGLIMNARLFAYALGLATMMAGSLSAEDATSAKPETEAADNAGGPTAKHGKRPGGKQGGPMMDILAGEPGQ